jgi:hypothetical protein
VRIDPLTGAESDTGPRLDVGIVHGARQDVQPVIDMLVGYMAASPRRPLSEAHPRRVSFTAASPGMLWPQPPRRARGIRGLAKTKGWATPIPSFSSPQSGVSVETKPLSA